LVIDSIALRAVGMCSQNRINFYWPELLKEKVQAFGNADYAGEKSAPLSRNLVSLALDHHPGRVPVMKIYLSGFVYLI